MPLPYGVMTLLYLFFAVLAAGNAALTSFGLIEWLPGLVWLRVHLITIGTMTQAAFGVLPVIVAVRSGEPRPQFRWATWLALNVGLLTLLIGIPLSNQALIYSGGSLVFLAVLLLGRQILGMRPNRSKMGTGRRFYLTGLAFLLLGIVIGSGLWFGIGTALGIAVPIEAHIHANNWGFMAFVFAGLLIDVFPDIGGRSLRWPRSLTPIFWMMLGGATLLVAAPWVGGDRSRFLVMPGIVLHLSATAWLLLNVVRASGGTFVTRQPGYWHLTTAYAWIVAPVLVAPLIILQVPGFPHGPIEQNAPQALIYGWVLQFGFAMVPYLFQRLLNPSEPARLGGNWFSLFATHLGGLSLWASIFVVGAGPALHGAAYLLWFLAMIPVALDLLRIFQTVGTGVAAHQVPDSPPSVSSAVPSNSLGTDRLASASNVG